MLLSHRPSAAEGFKVVGSARLPVALHGLGQHGDAAMCDATTALQDLAGYKKFKNKQVSSSARGLIGLFRCAGHPLDLDACSVPVGCAPLEQGISVQSQAGLAPAAPAPSSASTSNTGSARTSSSSTSNTGSASTSSSSTSSTPNLPASTCRELNPELLAKKDRGKGADIGMRPTAYGQGQVGGCFCFLRSVSRSEQWRSGMVDRSRERLVVDVGESVAGV